MSRHAIYRTSMLASAVLLALAAALPSAGGQASAPPSATQRDKNFEHELVQSDGVVHPRETLGSSRLAAPKRAAARMTQKDLDLEHEMVQSDGVDHPRPRVGDMRQQPTRAVARRATQQDFDHEHERLQSDGRYHPRELIRK